MIISVIGNGVKKLEIICKLGRVLCRTSYCPPTQGGTAAAAPPPFRSGNPLPSVGAFP